MVARTRQHHRLSCKMALCSLGIPNSSPATPCQACRTPSCYTQVKLPPSRLEVRLGRARAKEPKAYRAERNGMAVANFPSPGNAVLAVVWLGVPAQWGGCGGLKRMAGAN